VTVWIHQRKGRIEGTIVAQDSEWSDIELTESASLTMISRSADRDVKAGDIIRVRTDLLREVTE
jgi:hypothetical protein